MCVFLGVLLRESSAPWVWLPCSPGLSRSERVYLQLSSAWGRRDGAGHPCSVGAWGRARAAVRKSSNSSSRRDSENSFGDPGACEAPASLGATPEEAQAVPRGDLQRPLGKGVFEAEMMLNSQKGIPKGLGSRQLGEPWTQPCSPAPGLPWLCSPG